MADDQEIAELRKICEALEHKLKAAEGRVQSVYAFASDLRKDVKGLTETVSTVHKSFVDLGKDLKGLQGQFKAVGSTVKALGKPGDIKKMRNMVMMKRK